MVGEATSRRASFLANSCQTCKKLYPKYECDICRMVFYCSEIDRRDNWQAHSHLCRAIFNLCQAKGVRQLYQNAEGGSPETFRTMRHATAMECAKLLGRPLQPWELEILYWPRVCGVCFRQEGDLTCCKHCEFTYACSEEHFSKNHRDWCPTLKLYHDIVRFCQSEDIPALPKFEVPSEIKSMDDFLVNRYITPSSKIAEAFASEVLTYPLTVFCVLASLPPAESVHVHVVGAELQAEVLPLSKWEDFLMHLLPAGQQITLTFVGPDLHALLGVPVKGSVDLCQNCRNEGKRLEYELVCRTLYHDYLNQPAKPASPHLITAFNSGLYRTIGFEGSDSWSSTLEKIFAHGAPPILVTEYTSCEIRKDLDLIQKRFQNVQVVQGPEMNPFASKRPNLNVISDEEVPVIFKNYYSVVLSTIKVS